MEPSAYLEMARQQEKHWWFRARRQIIKTIFMRFIGLEKPHILEVGCGPGGNLAMLSELGDVSAMEMDNYAREFAAKFSGLHIVEGKLPDHIPFGKSKFDVICLFDVLEHIDDDQKALQKVHQRLTSHGKIILTVPAYPRLFSRHDSLHHHYRRYAQHELKHKVEQAGFNIEKVSHFNMFLLPLALLTRVFDSITHAKISTGMMIPISPLNALFYQIFKFEASLLKLFNFPFGLSLMVVATKNDS